MEAAATIGETMEDPGAVGGTGEETAVAAAGKQARRTYATVDVDGVTCMPLSRDSPVPR